MFFRPAVVLLGIWMYFCPAASTGTEAKFVLEITPSQDAVQPGIPVWKSGWPIFFIITMKNNSKHVLHFALTNPAWNYRTTVLDSNGKPVPETENYRKLREELRGRDFSTRNILVEVKPHETCSDTIEVSYLYDLSKPGEYTVQLERDMPPEIGTGVATSNTVKIRVEE